jgi:hypothetical protein
MNDSASAISLRLPHDDQFSAAVNWTKPFPVFIAAHLIAKELFSDALTMAV